MLGPRLLLINHWCFHESTLDELEFQPKFQSSETTVAQQIAKPTKQTPLAHKRLRMYETG